MNILKNVCEVWFCDGLKNALPYSIEACFSYTFKLIILAKNCQFLKQSVRWNKLKVYWPFATVVSHFMYRISYKQNKPSMYQKLNIYVDIAYN